MRVRLHSNEVIETVDEDTSRFTTHSVISHTTQSRYKEGVVILAAKQKWANSWRVSERHIARIMRSEDFERRLLRREPHTE